MIKVIAENRIKPENAKAVAPLFREIIAATRKEEGCIEYRLFTDPKNPEIYTFIEEWAGQAALDKHMAAEHFTRIIPKIGELSSKPLSVQVLEEFK
ncbi:antibiotic biosynthesis monooxygenase [Treponema primitia]|uniref:putative quinol monooxygenase n=1 Tax=Treponema primitia TaxID=88058 RepID=UPI0039817790